MFPELSGREKSNQLGHEKIVSHDGGKGVAGGEIVGRVKCLKKQRFCGERGKGMKAPLAWNEKIKGQKENGRSFAITSRKSITC